MIRYKSVSNHPSSRYHAWVRKIVRPFSSYNHNNILLVLSSHYHHPVYYHLLNALGSPYITVTDFGKDHSHESSCTTVLYGQMFSELSSLYSASVFNRPTKQAVPVMRYWYGTIILFSLMLGELSIMFCRYKHLVGGNLGTAVTLGQLVVQLYSSFQDKSCSQV